MESILRNSFRVKRPSNANSSACTRISKGSMAFDRPKNLASSRTPENHQSSKIILVVTSIDNKLLIRDGVER